MNRRAFLASASAAAVATAIPAAAPAAPLFDFANYLSACIFPPTTAFIRLGMNPVRMMQGLLEAEGFSINAVSFDDLAAHCEQTVPFQTNSTAEPDDIGGYLKAILL